jgi:adenylosuccinate lyase
VLPAHWLRVRKQLAQELGLENLIITSHVARENMAEIIKLLAPVGGSLGKVA